MIRKINKMHWRSRDHKDHKPIVRPITLAEVQSLSKILNDLLVKLQEASNPETPLITTIDEDEFWEAEDEEYEKYGNEGKLEMVTRRSQDYIMFRREQKTQEIHRLYEILNKLLSDQLSDDLKNFLG